MTKSYKLIILWLLTGVFLPQLKAQIGGRHVFEFLDLSPSARLTGLGDYLLTVSDQHLPLAIQNPAVLGDTIHGRLSFDHRFFFEGIDHGFAGYGHSFPKWKLAAFGGVQYIRYGDFSGADVFGNLTGPFSAGEMALILGASRPLMPRLRLGMNAKFIQSRFESYSAYGMAFDLGVWYEMPDSRTHWAFVIKNAGMQFKSYASIREPLPFDLRLAVSQRLQYLPFRFSITAHHLHRWNILYDDPGEENTVIFIGEDSSTSPIAVFVDNLFRHLVFNGEFLIGKKDNLSIRLAYNHLRRRELQVDNFVSLGGFSFGGGVKFGHFHLDYGYSIYHLAGGSSHIGLSMNVNKLFTRI